VVVHPAVAVNSLGELIALAKAKPGALYYGSGSRGSSTHLAGELFRSMAGVNFTHVPYKGSGPAITGLLGGQVQVMFGSGAVVPHVKAGRLKALAVTSPQPSALFPGLPTVAASGVPGYQSVAMFGIFAPAKTPDAIIKRLNNEIVRQLATPEVKERYNNSGSEVVGSTSAEFAATIKSEMARLGKVIKDNNIMAE
jgi:tripartite-type tricarboxylate transporter receptor subunit TctC